MRNSLGGSEKKYRKFMSAQDFLAVCKMKYPSSMLRHAVLFRVVTRKPCVVCKSVLSMGHHYDYSKPLNVVWLCARHHRIEHTLVGFGARKLGISDWLATYLNTRTFEIFH